MISKRDKTSPTQRGKAGLSKFARQLAGEWKRLELAKADITAIVAVSGGADSMALLLGLDELKQARKLNLKIIVAHLDHRLRVNSRSDAIWVKALAKSLGYAFTGRAADVSRRAAMSQDNLEQAARRVRYGFLSEVARKKRAQVILTAHTLDDQAETVLLNLLRGSGADGLRGIDPQRPLTRNGELKLVRPLLGWARRRDTEDYCSSRGVAFLTDEMNLDERYARVRVRRRLLPLMASFNPRIVEALARIAELFREDYAALEKKVDELLTASLPGAVSKNGKRGGRRRLRVQPLGASEAGLRRRALRKWIKICRGDLRRLERVHVLALESLLFGQRGGRVVELPGGAKVARRRDLLEYTD